MTQNIYDKADFFVEYSRLARSVEGLDGAPEWPTLRALLPDLRGRRILDLGCGFGWFCRWARQQGAAYALGIDVSANMLAKAKEFATDQAIDYRRGDLEDLELPPPSFDLAYSSLVFHYLENLGGLIGRVSRSLAPGGNLVFSVEHPMYTAPIKPGWSTGADGRTAWPVNSYLDEGPRSTDWLTAGVVKQHRTIATYLNLLIASGFTLPSPPRNGAPWAEEQVAGPHPDWSRACISGRRFLLGGRDATDGEAAARRAAMCVNSGLRSGQRSTAPGREARHHQHRRDQPQNPAEPQVSHHPVSRPICFSAAHQRSTLGLSTPDRREEEPDGPVRCKQLS